MKKITCTFFASLLGLGAIAQSYSTGTVTFFANYSGKVDVTNTTVTLTLIGPSTSWLGVGFNAPGLMDDIGKDVVIFDGTNMTDRSFDGLGVTPPLDTQNWTVVTNTINTGIRTVVATRSRVAGEGTDYTFPLAAQSLQLTFARGSGLTVTYHGSGNCGATVANLTLGNTDFDLASFKMYPNPAKDFTTIELPSHTDNVGIQIYDVSGRKVKETILSATDNKVDLSGLNSGMYLMHIKTIEGQGTKALVVN